LVRVEGVLVSVDARLPNALVREALAEKKLKPFRGYPRWEAECPYRGGRFDFRRRRPCGCCYLEVKSVTLVEGGCALFPDAPTERGRRHVEELARRARRGVHAAVVFVIQREDAKAFSPNVPADPELARALRQARGAGVELLAYRCFVPTEEILLAHTVPVRL
jgi:sugar fermentation stimulation protein A